jgi:hypothetical protein
MSGKLSPSPPPEELCPQLELVPPLVTLQCDRDNTRHSLRHDPWWCDAISYVMQLSTEPETSMGSGACRALADEDIMSLQPRRATIYLQHSKCAAFVNDTLATEQVNDGLKLYEMVGTTDEVPRQTVSPFGHSTSKRGVC